MMFIPSSTPNLLLNNTTTTTTTTTTLALKQVIMCSCPVPLTLSIVFQRTLFPPISIPSQAGPQLSQPDKAPVQRITVWHLSTNYTQLRVPDLLLCPIRKGIKTRLPAFDWLSWWSRGDIAVSQSEEQSH